MQTKQQTKAQKIVNKALDTFSKAITEIEKANTLLDEAVKEDIKQLEALSVGIEHAKNTIKLVNAEKLNKEAEIIQNKELIAKLERFTK